MEKQEMQDRISTEMKKAGEARGISQAVLSYALGRLNKKELEQMMKEYWIPEETVSVK